MTFPSRRLIRSGLVVTAVAGLAAADQARPNVVFIFMDDLGYGDIQPFNAQCPNQTPHLARMASEGMRLTSFYAYPVCTPSRAQLLTGCYAKRVSLPSVIFPAAAVGIHESERTIAAQLKTLGYATHCVGKWHVGDQPAFLPTRRGFDGYFGIPYSNDMGGDWDGNAASTGKRGKPPLPLLQDEKVIETLDAAGQTRLVERYVASSLDFIRANRDKPFFLYLAHSSVHVPIHPGPQFAGKSSNGPYGDWVAESDWSVGRILDTLRELKLDTNTLVVFTSDNGPWLTKGKDGGIAGPLRGGKGGTFEGGVRVPTIAWWPGRIAAGSTCAAVAGNVDLLPTCVALAGGTVPADRPIDGKDLGPLLLGTAKDLPDRVWHYFAGTRLEAVRQGPWKYAITPQSENMGKGKGEKKGAFTPTLYNLDTDIGETTDVAAQHPAVVERMKALVAAMDTDLGCTGSGPGVRPCGKVEDPKPLLLKR